MLKFAIPGALALGAGISVVVQQVLNANLRAELNSAVWSGLFSYALGLLCMMTLAVVDQTQYHGRPYATWFGRKQHLP